MDSKSLYTNVEAYLEDSSDDIWSFKPLTGAHTHLDKYKARILELSDDQAQAVYNALFGVYHCYTIIGNAGTGKSRVLVLLRDIFHGLFDVKVLVLSTVGLAASLVGGETAHSVLGIKRDYPLPTGTWALKDKYDKSRNPWVYRYIGAERKLNKLAVGAPNKKVLVIWDEFSCASSEFLVAAYDMLRRYKSMVSSSPILRFIMFGDPKQMGELHVGRDDDSVSKSSQAWLPARFVKYAKEDPTSEDHAVYIDQKIIQYGSLLLSSAEGGGPFVLDDTTRPEWNVIRYRLTTNHRQGANKAFGLALDNIGYGKTIDISDPTNPVNILTERFVYDLNKIPKDSVMLIAGNEKVTRYNQDIYDRATTPKQVYRAKFEMGDHKGYISEFSMRKRTLTIIPYGTEREVVIRLDDSGLSRENVRDLIGLLAGLEIPLENFIAQDCPWICRYNIREDIRIMNGTLGKVLEIKDESIIIERLDNNKVVEIKYYELKDVPKTAKGQPICTIQVLPGHMASAMTIAKSQGTTNPSTCGFWNEAWMGDTSKGYWNAGHYVGLSRVTEFENLYIYFPHSRNLTSAIATFNSSIKVDATAIEFEGKFEEFKEKEYPTYLSDTAVIEVEVKQKEEDTNIKNLPIIPMDFPLFGDHGLPVNTTQEAIAYGRCHTSRSYDMLRQYGLKVGSKFISTNTKRPELGEITCEVVSHYEITKAILDRDCDKIAQAEKHEFAAFKKYIADLLLKGKRVYGMYFKPLLEKPKEEKEMEELEFDLLAQYQDAVEERPFEFSAPVDETDWLQINTVGKYPCAMDLDLLNPKVKKQIIISADPNTYEIRAVDWGTNNSFEGEEIEEAFPGLTEAYYAVYPLLIEDEEEFVIPDIDWDSPEVKRAVYMKTLERRPVAFGPQTEKGDWLETETIEDYRYVGADSSDWIIIVSDKATNEAVSFIWGGKTYSIELIETMLPTMLETFYATYPRKEVIAPIAQPVEVEVKAEAPTPIKTEVVEALVEVKTEPTQSAPINLGEYVLVTGGNTLTERLAYNSAKELGLTIAGFGNPSNIEVAEIVESETEDYYLQVRENAAIADAVICLGYTSFEGQQVQQYVKNERAADFTYEGLNPDEDAETDAEDIFNEFAEKGIRTIFITGEENLTEQQKAFNLRFLNKFFALMKGGAESTPAPVIEPIPTPPTPEVAEEVAQPVADDRLAQALVRIAELEAENAQLKAVASEVAQLRAENENLRKECNSHAGRIAGLEAAVEKLVAGFEQLSKENVALKAQIAAMQSFAGSQKAPESEGVVMAKTIAACPAALDVLATSLTKHPKLNKRE